MIGRLNFEYRRYPHSSSFFSGSGCERITREHESTGDLLCNNQLSVWFAIVGSNFNMSKLSIQNAIFTVRKVGCFHRSSSLSNNSEIKARANEYILNNIFFARGDFNSKVDRRLSAKYFRWNRRSRWDSLRFCQSPSCFSRKTPFCWPNSHFLYVWNGSGVRLHTFVC